MFEFLFNYSPEVYAQGRYIFANAWPVEILPGVFLVLALIVVFFLYKRRLALGKAQLAGIGILQVLMLAIVLVLVWRPALLLERLRPGDNVIALMLDTSASMAYGAADQIPVERAKTLLAEPPFEQLRRSYQFRHYVFADGAEPAADYDALPAPGAATRLGDSILQVLRQASTASLGAIVLLSDGADNAGAIEPQQLAEIGGYGVPIHAIGLGREKLPEDVELTEVIVPAKALPNSSLSAQVTIRHDAGGEARVKVYDGDDFLAAKTVSLADNESATTQWLDFRLEGTGYRDLRFSIDPWPEEVNVGNNAQTRVINVPEAKYRVLYIEGEPRWEYKFMRRAVADDRSVQLVTLLQVSPNKFYRQGIDDPEELAGGFPTEKSDLYPFHAVIIGSIDAALFTPEQQNLLHDFVSERGGGLLMLAGPNGLGSGGWDNTVIGDVLPAASPEMENAFNRTRAAVRRTPAGRRSPLLKFSEDAAENDKLWRDLPDIADYQVLGALRPAAVTLLEVVVDQRPQPLFVTQPYGRGRSYILATGGTWRWQMSLPVDDQRHEIFWRQVIRELVAHAPESFALSGELRGGKLVIHAEARDENFEPLTDISVAAVVTQAEGEPVTLNLLPAPEQPGVFQGELTPEHPGLVAIEAISSRGDDPLATARMSLYNDAGNAEYFSLRQNRGLLERLAETTGGRYWEPDQLDQLPDAIQLSRAGITEQEIRPLWDAPAVFLLLLLLKTVEWCLRRRWRTI